MGWFVIGMWGILLVLASGAQAAPGDRQYLGAGWVVTNDLIDGGNDRWRTGSFAASWVWGPEWTGRAPRAFGQVLEFRAQGEVIAPEFLSDPGPGDRPFVGALSFGLHSHFDRSGWDTAVGGDLVITGPQTGLDDFQRALHDLLGGVDASPSVLNAQISNNVYPTLVAESGRRLPIGRKSVIRPFAEARWGVETLVRIGADLTFGHVGQRELLVREPVAGQRYRILTNDYSGLSFTAGADFAYVDESNFLPRDQGFSPKNFRTRVRTGVHWQSQKKAVAFFGVTWLSEEFDGQRDEQFVGSLQLKLNF